MSNITDALKEARAQRSWSIRELSRRTNIAASVISDLERGRTTKSRYIVELASALGLRVEYSNQEGVMLHPKTAGGDASLLDGFGDVLPVLTDKDLARLFSDDGLDLSAESLKGVQTKRSLHEGLAGFWLHYEGQAMVPSLHAGEDLLVNASLAAESGDVVVAFLAGDRLPVVRRLVQEAGTSALVADNETWPGRVVEVRVVDTQGWLKPESVDVRPVRAIILGVVTDVARSLV